MPKKSKPKLSRAAVNAVDAMWKALPELELLMRATDFAALYTAVERAREYAGTVGMLTDEGRTRTDRDGLIEGDGFARSVETMDARHAFLAMSAVSPPPDEPHWLGREPRSDWTRRYVATMKLLGFTKTQAYEAADETRRGRRGRRRPEAPPSDNEIIVERIKTKLGFRPARRGAGR